MSLTRYLISVLLFSLIVEDTASSFSFTISSSLISWEPAPSPISSSAYMVSHLFSGFCRFLKPFFSEPGIFIPGSNRGHPAAGNINDQLQYDSANSRGKSGLFTTFPSLLRSVTSSCGVGGRMIFRVLVTDSGTAANIRENALSWDKSCLAIANCNGGYTTSCWK